MTVKGYIIISPVQITAPILAQRALPVFPNGIPSIALATPFGPIGGIG
jgi:hypothetical protein